MRLTSYHPSGTQLSSTRSGRGCSPAINLRNGSYRPSGELSRRSKQAAGRRFGLFVDADVQYADLLTVEIGNLLADPAPSDQGTRDGDSSKAVNVVWMAGAVTANSDLVDALLNNMDADPSLATRPGYRRLISNLAGLSSSMPTRGARRFAPTWTGSRDTLAGALTFRRTQNFLQRCPRDAKEAVKICSGAPFRTPGQASSPLQSAYGGPPRRTATRWLELLRGRS